MVSRQSTPRGDQDLAHLHSEPRQRGLGLRLPDPVHRRLRHRLRLRRHGDRLAAHPPRQTASYRCHFDRWLDQVIRIRGVPIPYGARPSQAIHGIPDPYPELMQPPPPEGELLAPPVLGGRSVSTRARLRSTLLRCPRMKGRDLWDDPEAAALRAMHPLCIPLTQRHDDSESLVALAAQVLIGRHAETLRTGDRAIRSMIRGGASPALRETAEPAPGMPSAPSCYAPSRCAHIHPSSICLPAGTPSAPGRRGPGERRPAPAARHPPANSEACPVAPGGSGLLDRPPQALVRLGRPLILVCTGTIAPSGPDPPTRCLPPKHESDLRPASLAASLTRHPAWESLDWPGGHRDGVSQSTTLKLNGRLVAIRKLSILVR